MKARPSTTRATCTSSISQSRALSGNWRQGRPNPNYSSILNFTTPDAAGSIYNGLQVSVNHRFSQNFSAQIAWTLSRLKDSTTGPFYYPDNQMNLAAEWAASPDNQTNTLTTAASYQMKWGVSLSGSFHYGSGQNFQVTSSQNPFGLSGFTDRIFTSSTAYFIPSQFVKPSTVPGFSIVQRDALVGNQIVRLDLRLSKTFTLKERFRFIPMVEAFNLFNHSNFGGYQTNINTASYGAPTQVTDLPYYPRMLQFVGRFEF